MVGQFTNRIEGIRTQVDPAIWPIGTVAADAQVRLWRVDPSAVIGYKNL